MQKIALVTDSTAYLTPTLIARYQVHVIPLYLYFEDQTYRDGVDIDTATFFRLLRRSSTLPTTSQPSLGDFLSLYRKLSEVAETIISIHISSGISGTVTTAEMARQALMEEMASPPRIEIIDSRSTAAGLALLVTAAGRAIAIGRSVDEVVATVRSIAERMEVFFVVDTLTYLHKGGRIGGAAALVGSMLQIKPILCLREGKIDLLERARTTRRARRRLLELVEARAGDRPIHAAVIHADALSAAEMIRRRVASRVDCRELLLLELSPAIATHVGPGTVGLAFYTL